MKTGTDIWFGRKPLPANGISGRRNVVVEEVEYLEKVVRYTKLSQEAGIAGKEFATLSSEDQQFVLDTDPEVSQNGTLMPKVEDILRIYVRDVDTGIIMRWRNGISIRIPHWPRRNKDTGEVINVNDFVNAGDAWPSKDLFAFLEAVTGKEVPRKGFVLSEYLNKGFEFSVEVEQDEKGFARVTKNSWQPKVSVSQEVHGDNIEIPFRQLGEAAEMLYTVLRENKEYVNGKPKSFVAMTGIAELIANGKLPMNHAGAMDAWGQLRGYVTNEEGIVSI